MMINAKYVKGNMAIQKAFYAEGRIAIKLEDAETHAPWCVATVNIPEYDLKEGHVFLKGWSENEGVPEELDRLGVVELTGRKVQTGFVYAQEAKLLI